jgi:hypothetical protein
VPAITVLAVSRNPRHRFSKERVGAISLVAGIGVEGDAHAGHAVKHRSRVARDPFQPNLRQVHLIHAELFAELDALGFEIAPGQLGENVTTQGIDLLGLPSGARLHLGDEVVVRITGLRNPCSQLDRFRPGLMAAVLDRSADGRIVRKAGIMAVVEAGGTVREGDAIRVAMPPVPHRALEPV